MATKTYNKLVRDLIPDIIEESGNECRTRTLSDGEYLKMLDLKLDEELAEYHKDQNIEELESVRAEKAKTRGGFDKKIFLIDITEKA